MTVTTKQQIIQEVEAMSEIEYPLRGLPVEYIDPLEPVMIDDWELA